MEIKKSLTLLELIIVLVVAGVLVTFAVPSYWGARQKAAEREAQAMLVLIQAAEKVRYLETASYVSCGDTIACNTNLNLDIPAGSFNYSVTTGTDFCVQATSTTGTTTFHIRTDDTAPVSGSC